MSESRPLLRKLLTTLLLLAALVGAYFLYDWYDGRLQTQLTDLTKQVQEADARRAQAERLNESLGFELANLKARHQETLTAKEGLEQDLETLKAAEATELAAAQQRTQAATAERDKVTAAYAELQKLQESAKQRIASLEADLSTINGAIANAAAAHQAKVAELERHLNERISLSRTTPMDAELVRAAQAIGVLPAEGGDGTDQDALSRQLAEAKAELEKLQSDDQAVREQLAKTEEALRESQDRLAEHQEQEGGSAELESQVKELQARLQDDQQIITDLKAQNAAVAERQAETDKLAQTLSELQAQRQTDQQTIADLTARNDSATAETNACTEKAAAAASQVADLTAKLASEEQARTELQQQNDAAPSTAPAPDCGAQPTAETAARLQALERSLDEERHNSARALDELRSLYTAVSALGGVYTDHGFLLRLAETELHFPPGQATLGTGKYPSLDRIAALLAQRPDLSVRIEGHTDSLGAAERNLALARQRAIAVEQALIERGVAAERLTAEGIGAARPLADNATAEGRSRNRRVEIYVTP